MKFYIFLSFMTFSVIPIGPGCSSSVADLAFVLDGSASVGESGFNLLRAFVMAVVDEFQNIGSNGIRVAIVQYSDSPRTELSFEDSTTKREVLVAVRNMAYISGNTRTGLALSHVNMMFQRSTRRGRKVAVVITDGRSQDEVGPPSQDLKRQDVNMFAIGVGEALVSELQEIASDPTDQHIYRVDEFVAISSIKEALVQGVCESVDGVYTESARRGRNLYAAIGYICNRTLLNLGDPGDFDQLVYLIYSGPEGEDGSDDGIIFPDTGNESPEEGGAGADEGGSGSELEFS